MVTSLLALGVILTVLTAPGLIAQAVSSRTPEKDR